MGISFSEISKLLLSEKSNQCVFAILIGSIAAWVFIPEQYVPYAKVAFWICIAWFGFALVVGIIKRCLDNIQYNQQIEAEKETNAFFDNIWRKDVLSFISSLSDDELSTLHTILTQLSADSAYPNRKHATTWDQKVTCSPIIHKNFDIQTHTKYGMKEISCLTIDTLHESYTLYFDSVFFEELNKKLKICQ